MEFRLNTCIYEKEKDVLNKNIKADSMKNIGFNCVFIEGDADNLFKYMANNKVDILISNANGFDEERFSYVLDIVHSNFCKEILVIGEDRDKYGDYVRFMPDDSLSNLDLKLKTELLKMKQEIEMTPSRNITLIQSKICEFLYEFKFSSRHDGFKYFVDAISRAYLIFPYNYSTMELYREVAEKYGKTPSAVEKSMRTALLNAFAKLKDAPTTPENVKLKSSLTYNMNNNMAISMLVSKLILDKDIAYDYNSKLVNVIYH